MVGSLGFDGDLFGLITKQQIDLVSVAFARFACSQALDAGGDC
jgi:hypothetical protein